MALGVLGEAALRRCASLARHLAPPCAAPLGAAARVARCPASAAGSTGLLAGRVAVITGSGAGIGEAAAKLFADEGAYVVVTDVNRARCLAVAEAINSAHAGCNPPRAIAVPGDVTGERFAKDIVDEAVRTYGGVDILVNNAGYTWDGAIHKTTQKQWDAMLLVHCTAPFRLIQAVEPHMRGAAKREIETLGAPRERVIINVSSTTGVHGNSMQANYATAKAGVIGLTKAVAKEWGSFGVRCNAIAYGYMQTRLTASREATVAAGEGVQLPDGTTVQVGVKGVDFAEVAKRSVPLKRMGTVQEAAGAMLMLASPHAGYVTGVCLPVEGGLGM